MEVQRSNENAFSTLGGPHMRTRKPPHLSGASARPPRGVWPLALLAAFALVAGACGSRLSEEALGEYDARRVSGPAGPSSVVVDDGTGPASFGTGVGGASTVPGSDAGGADSGTPAAAGADSGTSVAAQAGSTASSTGGGAEGAAAQQACRGGNTGTGVTADEITVAGMVTDSGPLPGATAGAYRGAAAYFAKVNAEGGVCGRKITILKGDDGLDPARGRAEFTRLEPKVLAFVGNLAVADSGYIDLIESTGVPYVGGTTDPAGRDLPSAVPHAATGNTFYSTPFAYYRQAEPDVENLAFLFADVGGVRANTPGAKAAIEAEGYDIVYESGANVAAPDYTSEVINMRGSGADFVYLFAFEINMQVRLARTMRQQNFDPAIKINTIGYHSRLVELLGDTANGWGSYVPHAPILNAGEAGRNPGLADFLGWNERLFPGAQLDLFPVGGWSDAHLFVEALRQIGPDVTRAKVIDVIDNQIERTDGGGIEPERTVGEVIPCFVMVKVVDQKWVREHPQSGYECELGQKVDF